MSEGRSAFGLLFLCNGMMGTVRARCLTKSVFAEGSAGVPKRALRARRAKRHRGSASNSSQISVSAVIISNISTQMQPEPRREGGGRRGLLRFVVNHLGFAVLSSQEDVLERLAMNAADIPKEPAKTAILRDIPKEPAKTAILRLLFADGFPAKDDFRWDSTTFPGLTGRLCPRLGAARRRT